jgi:hypothetical protein
MPKLSKNAGGNSTCLATAKKTKYKSSKDNAHNELSHAFVNVNRALAKHAY